MKFTIVDETKTQWLYKFEYSIYKRSETGALTPYIVKSETTWHDKGSSSGWGTYSGTATIDSNWGMLKTEVYVDGNTTVYLHDNFPFLFFGKDGDNMMFMEAKSCSMLPKPTGRDQPLLGVSMGVTGTAVSKSSSEEISSKISGTITVISETATYYETRTELITDYGSTVETRWSPKNNEAEGYVKINTETISTAWGNLTVDVYYMKITDETSSAEATQWIFNTIEFGEIPLKLISSGYDAYSEFTITLTVTSFKLNGIDYNPFN